MTYLSFPIKINGTLIFSYSYNPHKEYWEFFDEYNRLVYTIYEDLDTYYNISEEDEINYIETMFGE